VKEALEWIGFCLFFALLCATCGGVTVGGRHYEVSCGHGVDIINEAVVGRPTK
jgi:hypothetical protein